MIAAALAVALLFAMKQRWPARADLGSLVIVALGVVVGFPLLTALALQHVTSAHSLVFIGLLPLSTAIFGVLRGGERPKPAYWLFAAIGSLTVAGFAFSRSGSAAQAGDLFMIAAVVVCGLGYAEGAKLSRRMGGWQVISWSLVISVPLMAGLSLLTMPPVWNEVPSSAWIGLAYVSAFSMFLGFVFWYYGLAAGGIASIGQLQLLQPFMGLALAAALLGEPVAWTMVAVAGVVVLCVAGSRRFAR
jgi:drug/metabolite transporter (DMT)-like permease